MMDIFFAISVIISLLYYEVTEISPGGIIVPGYIALFIDQPIRIIVTFIISMIAYFILKILGKCLLVYGKRKFAIAVILGILLKLMFSKLSLGIGGMSITFAAVGNIIPGVIAFECDKQGTFKTLISLVIVSVVLKLLLILIQGSVFI